MCDKFYKQMQIHKHISFTGTSPGGIKNESIY